MNGKLDAPKLLECHIPGLAVGGCCVTWMRSLAFVLLVVGVMQGFVCFLTFFTGNCKNGNKEFLHPASLDGDIQPVYMIKTRKLALVH